MKITSNSNRNEDFRAVCKVVNLRYEYEGFTGDKQWAIISELPEQKLYEIYPDEIAPYVPFVCLSVEQGKIFAEYDRNEDKFRKRRQKNESVFGFDELTETEHIEIAVPDFIEQRELEEYYEKREEKKMKLLVQAMESLTEKQHKYLVMRYIDGKSARDIAKEEGIAHQVVDKHILAAKKKFEKVFEEFFKK